MRIKFDEQLALLNHELIAMGALCEEAIAITARSVMDNDRGPERAACVTWSIR